MAPLRLRLRGSEAPGDVRPTRCPVCEQEAKDITSRPFTGSLSDALLVVILRSPPLSSPRAFSLPLIGRRG
jgi:hypothetical protein